MVPALHGPLQADQRPGGCCAPSQSPRSCGHARRSLMSSCVLSRSGRVRAADGAEPDGLDAVLHAVRKQLRLLEAGVQLHLDEGRTSRGTAADTASSFGIVMFDMPMVLRTRPMSCKALHLTPRGHEVPPRRNGLGIRVAGIAVAPRGMVVRQTASARNRRPGNRGAGP